jgi:hypothetical protein
MRGVTRVALGEIRAFEQVVARHMKDQATAAGYGSPCVSEIELNRVLVREWSNVVKWLNNLDLLRAAGIGAAILHA